MNVKVELSGGLELIFKTKELTVTFDEPNLKAVSIKDLVFKLKDKIFERPEFFITTSFEIRPGILVFVNDCDWEIYDKELTLLNNNDSVSFISTLHGG